MPEIILKLKHTIMEKLQLNIKNIKNISTAKLEIPFENGIYTFVGTNGCGKSTLMLCLAQLISNQLRRLAKNDLQKDSSVEIIINDSSVVWKPTDQMYEWRFDSKNWIRYGGLYEGSLFYGTRFEDSTNVEQMMESNRILHNNIVDADDYVKRHMSYILHGDLDHYKTLKRLKNRTIAKELNIKNLPYFIDIDGKIISQYRMSSGECLLVSLLHFLYNSIERRSIPIHQKAIVLIDELELALHPIAIARLMNFLKTLVDDHSNLVIYLSTHSQEVIRTMSPLDLYKINNIQGNLTIENNCYPSYLIRDLYSNISPDFLLLVEDQLAQLIVNKLLSKYSLRAAKLIHCVPVGGWQNVLDLHKELYTKKILGSNTKIISVLDGDVEGKLKKDQKKLPHLFLPIPSVEKFLYAIIKQNENPQLKRIINDKYFIVNSLDDIISQYNQKTLSGSNDDNKNFYKKIISELNQIGTSEAVFIAGLCDDIIENIDTNRFINSLKQQLQ